MFKAYKHIKFSFLLVIVLQLLLSNVYGSGFKSISPFFSKVLTEKKHVCKNIYHTQLSSDHDYDVEISVDERDIESEECAIRNNRESIINIQVEDFKLMTAFFDIWFSEFTEKCTNLHYIQLNAAIPQPTYYNHLFRQTLF